MSYRGKVADMKRVAALRALSRRGLLGLGATDDEQAPVVAPTGTQTNPILSTSSVMASQIMLRMAALPRSKRLGEMVSILNAAQRGLGDKAKVDFMRLSAQRPANMKDQTMFDVITASVGNVLTARTLAAGGHGVSGLGQSHADFDPRRQTGWRPAKRRSRYAGPERHIFGGMMSGLGQTVAEVQGRTSGGVNDANALFCSYGAGTTGLVSGLLAQFNTGGSSSTAGITGAQAGGQIAGCGAGQLALQAQTAQAQAQAAQSAGLQQLQMQQHQEQMTFQYLLLGGGGLVIATVLYAVLKK